MSKEDTIIILAFPETNVIQVNMWYDTITTFLGYNKNEHYMAGHAAAILVEKKSGNSYYFDFGRYHTPPKYGRIRDYQTDPELQFFSKGQFSQKGKLLNHLEIIEELSKNTASHGDGKIVFSIYNGIDFQKAYQFAKKWQSKGTIPYGPFELKGTNCSRFVARLVKAGNPDIITKTKLNLPKYSTASPVGNVRNTNKQTTKSIFEKNINTPTLDVSKRNRNRTLAAPEKPSNLAKNAQWLSGEGAGSWFTISSKENKFIISRHSPKGVLEFEKKFKTSTKFDITTDYQFTYISNGMECNLIQDGKTICFLAL